MRVKLKAVTFCLNEKPMDELLWCNKVPKGKRNKPSKINGIQHHEISGLIYQSTLSSVTDCNKRLRLGG